MPNIWNMGYVRGWRGAWNFMFPVKGPSLHRNPYVVSSPELPSEEEWFYCWYWLYRISLYLPCFSMEDGVFCVIKGNQRSVSTQVPLVNSDVMVGHILKRKKKTLVLNYSPCKVGRPYLWVVITASYQVRKINVVYNNQIMSSISCRIFSFSFDSDIATNLPCHWKHDVVYY